MEIISFSKEGGILGELQLEFKTPPDGSDGFIHLLWRWSFPKLKKLLSDDHIFNKFLDESAYCSGKICSVLHADK
jgi:hypothetical protein